MYNYFNDKGTIGFTCDICGRELNGCSIVNGMKFCAKCYQETFGKDNQQNEIQQLKQQLEEKDKDKIQLAIQELEKVKKLIFEKAKENNASTSDHIFRYNIVNKVIDNQIKELKRE